MESNIFMKSAVPKKLSIIVLLLLSLTLASCGGSWHMADQASPPTLAPKSDKAVLVIVRTTSLGWALTFDNYIDGKMIGQTRGKSFFIAEVNPGTHLVMAKAENVAAAKINFEAGRIYLLDQGVYPGFWTMRTGFSPMTAEDAKKQLGEEGMQYRIYDTGNPGPDMESKDYEETKADFEKEVKEDPARHKNILDYRGVAKM